MVYTRSIPSITESNVDHNIFQNMTADKKSQNLRHSCINHDDNTLTAKEMKWQNNKYIEQNKRRSHEIKPVKYHRENISITLRKYIDSHTFSGWQRLLLDK